MSSATSSPADTTPRAPRSTQDAMTIPMGKYHPSNYKIMSPNHTMPLQIPASRHANKRPGHEHSNFDAKRKLQEYQRSVIAQARLLSGGEAACRPVSPKLEPLGSPGPITPFELEELGDGTAGYNPGYMVAGAKARGGRSDREVIGGMIRAEEERRKGARSPVVAAR